MTSTPKRHSHILWLANLTNQELDQYFAGCDIQNVDLQAIESEASAVAQAAAKLAEYVGHRGSYGCGDHGHEKALTAAGKRVKRVRKALGYTYP